MALVLPLTIQRRAAPFVLCCVGGAEVGVPMTMTMLVVLCVRACMLLCYCYCLLLATQKQRHNDQQRCVQIQYLLNENILTRSTHDATHYQYVR